MAVMPGVPFRPVPNRTVDGQLSTFGVVLHVMEGTLSGTDSWFRNRASQASAHFGIGKSGEVYQWVDTEDRAWAQASGNTSWLSIEHEGNSGESLTEAQLNASARVIAWMHKTHGIPLTISDHAGIRGIGWHGMGGTMWGGHPDCPGTPIKNQRGALIREASAILEGDDMALSDAQAKQLIADVAEIKKKVDSVESNLLHIGDIDTNPELEKRTMHGAGYYLANILHILRGGASR